MENFLRAQQQPSSEDEQTRLWAETEHHYDADALQVLAAPPVFPQRDVDARELRLQHAAEVFAELHRLMSSPEVGPPTAPELVRQIEAVAEMVAREIEIFGAPPELLAEGDEIETAWRWMQHNAARADEPTVADVAARMILD